MNSNQINNHSKLPYRNSTIDEFGRVRILSFDCPVLSLVNVEETITLAKLPAGQVKVLSIHLQYSNLENADVNYFLSQANALDPFFIEKQVDLKTVTLDAMGENSTIINYRLESQSGVCINASVSKDIPAGTLFNGYILYVID